MSKQTNVLTIRVPRDLKERFEKMAHQQGVSMNQLAIYAFTREIGQLEAASFLKDQYQGATKQQILQEFDDFMDHVPRRRRRPAWDEIESS